MNKLFLTILILAASTSASGQQAFSSLEEQMTGAEFKATGLEKLSADELAALNNWVRGRSLVTLDAPAAGVATATGSGDARGFETQKISDMDKTTITSNLVGKFSGWDGQTTFKLENGMIWQQADKDKFYIKEVENPVIIIEPGAFGTWKLSVEGFSSKCKVERIQ
jgi:hypothetical protein